MADHRYVESGSGFCAICDDQPGEGQHAVTETLEASVTAEWLRATTALLELPNGPALLREVAKQVATDIEFEEKK